MVALFLLIGGAGLVAALLALHFRVCDLEATLRERGILADGASDPAAPPRNHRAAPAPHRVSNPDKPTRRPGGPLPDPPPTGRVRPYSGEPKP